MVEDVMKAKSSNARPFTVAVDFDGVIHGYSKGWHDGTIYDPPKPGCAAVLRRLQKFQGIRIIIFTTRVHTRIVGGVLQNGQAKEVAEYLYLHEIPYDEIHIGLGKPLCHVWLDDRAVRFENWSQAQRDIHRLVNEYSS